MPEAPLSRREALELEKSHAIARSHWPMVKRLYQMIDELPEFPAGYTEVEPSQWASGVTVKRNTPKIRGKAAVKAAKRQRRMGRQHPNILR